jgi:hypothetical protein
MYLRHCFKKWRGLRPYLPPSVFHDFKYKILILNE